MSAATIDLWLAGDRAKLLPGGLSHTKPGSLLKDGIPVRTWAQRDDTVSGGRGDRPGRHEAATPSGDFCSTLTVTDIATGWTETHAKRNKHSAGQWSHDRKDRLIPLSQQGESTWARQRAARG
jgi:hypothetical protein